MLEFVCGGSVEVAVLVVDSDAEKQSILHRFIVKTLYRMVLLTLRKALVDKNVSNRREATSI